MEEEEIITEETIIDVVGVIPAHLKEFENISIDSVSPSNIYVTIDGNKLKGKITDTIETNLFFALDQETQNATVISSADKTVTLENIFYVPKDEFTKPFVPTDAIKKPE
ncbi:hypothetical protein GPJ56_002151 [Histomonas meleagridis]|uniref:uncharacterized protein n=1 Tax=Histomonas meleagridis TaxID=135588 RepID=UPI00355A884D|nr:hypothetical protein GPJ56_002151 [Histomonas meleagridis]KAH0806670.1 hypothetical protein GO595_000521 [Histomonas meleagridis]